MVKSFDEACRRAGGRRRYNHQREDAKRARQEQVTRLLDGCGPYRRGVQAKIARQLGVSEATISRDVRDILLVKWAEENPSKAFRLLFGPPALRIT